MRKEEKEEEKAKGEKRKPYRKPALTEEELFEATVLACQKMPGNQCRSSNKWS